MAPIRIPVPATVGTASAWVASNGTAAMTAQILQSGPTDVVAVYGNNSNAAPPALSDLLGIVRGNSVQSITSSSKSYYAVVRMCSDPSSANTLTMELSSDTSPPVLWAPHSSPATFVYVEPAALTVSATGAIQQAASCDNSGITLVASAGNEPVVTQGQFGNTAIRTSNVNTKLRSATGGPTGNQPFHMIAICEYNSFDTSGIGYSTAFIAGDTGDPANVGFGANTTQIYAGGNNYQLGPLAATENILSLATSPTVKLVRMLEIINDGAGTVSLKVNGKFYTSFAHTYNLNAPFGFMNFVPGFAALDVTFHALAFKANGTYSNADVQNFVRYVSRKLNDKIRIVQFFGDSTVIASSPLDLPLTVRAAQRGGVAILQQNCGQTSLRTDEIYNLKILPNTDPATDAYYQAGYNDIFQISPAGGPSVSPTADARTIYNQIAASNEVLKSRGLRTSISTLWTFAAAAANPAGYFALTEAALNALILGNSAGFDDVDDTGNIMNPYNAGNFIADGLGVHPLGTTNARIIGPVVYLGLGV